MAWTLTPRRDRSVWFNRRFQERCLSCRISAKRLLHRQRLPRRLCPRRFPYRIGQIVGVVAFDGYYASDIASYETRAGQSAGNLENVLLDGADGSVHSFLDDQEVSLDIENVIAMAPGLFQVTVYEGYSGYDILNEIAVPTHGELLPKQVTCSWCWNGGSKSVIDQILQQMAAQGQSFFTCSGDGDVWCDGIFIPLDDPFATVVGGTELSMTGSLAGLILPKQSGILGTTPLANITGNGYVGSGGGIKSRVF